MAQTFKTAVDFELNQSENFVLESLPSLPSGEALILGRVFIFTDSNGQVTPFYYDGTALLPFRGLNATTLTDGLMSAIDKTKLDAIQGNGGGSGGNSQSSPQGYQRAFSQKDLTSGGILLVNHGLNGYPAGITVYNGSGRVVSPYSIDLLNLNTISIDFAGLTPLQGSYRIALLSVISPANSVQYYAESISLREGGVSEGSFVPSTSGISVSYLLYADGIILRENGTPNNTATQETVHQRYADEIILRENGTPNNTVTQGIPYQRYFDSITLREAGADKNLMTADVLYITTIPGTTKVADGSILRGVIGNSVLSLAARVFLTRYSDGLTLVGLSSDTTFTVTSGINPALIYGFI